MHDRELRNKLIRVAHANPDLRPDLLPLLREANETDPWSLFLPPEKMKKLEQYKAERERAYKQWIEGEHRTWQVKLGDNLKDVFDYLQKNPLVSAGVLAGYLNKVFFPTTLPPDDAYAKKISEAHHRAVIHTDGGDRGNTLEEFGKLLQQRGLVLPRWRRVIRRWLMASEDRWAMLSMEDRDLAGYALRYVQERQGWHNAVTRLRTGVWTWPQFEQRARGILQGYPGSLDPQLVGYIINKLKNLFEQGNFDLLDRYTPRAVL